MSRFPQRRLGVVAREPLSAITGERMDGFRFERDPTHPMIARVGDVELILVAIEGNAFGTV